MPNVPLSVVGSGSPQQLVSTRLLLELLLLELLLDDDDELLLDDELDEDELDELLDDELLPPPPPDEPGGGLPLPSLPPEEPLPEPDEPLSLLLGVELLLGVLDDDTLLELELLLLELEHASTRQTVSDEGQSQRALSSSTKFVHSKHPIPHVS